MLQILAVPRRIPTPLILEIAPLPPPEYDIPETFLSPLQTRKSFPKSLLNINDPKFANTWLKHFKPLFDGQTDIDKTLNKILNQIPESKHFKYQTWTYNSNGVIISVPTSLLRGHYKQLAKYISKMIDTYQAQNNAIKERLFKTFKRKANLNDEIEKQLVAAIKTSLDMTKEQLNVLQKIAPTIEFTAYVKQERDAQECHNFMLAKDSDSDYAYKMASTQFETIWSQSILPRLTEMEMLTKQLQTSVPKVNQMHGQFMNEMKRIFGENTLKSNQFTQDLKLSKRKILFHKIIDEQLKVTANKKNIQSLLNFLKETFDKYVDMKHDLNILLSTLSNRAMLVLTSSQVPKQFPWQNVTTNYPSDEMYQNYEKFQKRIHGYVNAALTITNTFLMSNDLENVLNAIRQHSSSGSIVFQINFNAISTEIQKTHQEISELNNKLNVEHLASNLISFRKEFSTLLRYEHFDMTRFYQAANNVLQVDAEYAAADENAELVKIRPLLMQCKDAMNRLFSAQKQTMDALGKSLDFETKDKTYSVRDIGSVPTQPLEKRIKSFVRKMTEECDCDPFSGHVCEHCN